jgi:hypothetical protein
MAAPHATERIFRHAVTMLCHRLKRQVRREHFGHRLFKPKQGGRLLVKKRSFWRFLRKPLKPFEDRCPRIEAPWPRLISGVSTCQPIDAGRATRDSDKTPGLPQLLSTVHLLYHQSGWERKGVMTKLVPDSKESCDIRHRPPQQFRERNWS